ncbi:MAG: LrgB family protein [Betaproteobacteria bacterium]|nr:LrgB family protein [Betaproteobacteria bacterium]
MTPSISLIQDHPLFGLLVTVLAYAAAMRIWRRFGMPALFHPVLVATALIALTLFATDLSYEAYFAQTSLLNEALAVVIVLLAVPLSRQMHLIVEAGHPMALTLLAGSVVAIMTALALPYAFGAEDHLIAALAPKSATAAVAVGIAEKLGGPAGLTAVVVISTGIFGGIFGPTILAAAGVEDDRAKGFALGVASHAIGTARAFQISDVAGAFASLGMILNALLTTALVPIAIALMR